MNILALDTSSARGSAAVRTKDGQITSIRISETLDHARNLVPAVTAMLKEKGLELSDIDIAVFGKGPGSFIGTRIAMVAVQAMAQAHNIKLLPLSSLAAYDFSAMPFASDNERHIYVCKSKSGTYNFIIRTAKDPKTPTEADAQELSDEEFLAMLKPSDILIGPLTEKNMAAIEKKISLRTISMHPSAQALIENNLDTILAQGNEG